MRVSESESERERGGEGARGRTGKLLSLVNLPQRNPEGRAAPPRLPLSRRRPCTQAPRDLAVLWAGASVPAVSQQLPLQAPFQTAPSEGEDLLPPTEQHVLTQTPDPTRSTLSPTPGEEQTGPA